MINAAYYHSTTKIFVYAVAAAFLESLLFKLAALFL
jgi:hypothetical protein